MHEAETELPRVVFVHEQVFEEKLRMCRLCWHVVWVP